jgi:hypothetical protein
MPTVPGSANGSPGSCSASRVLSIAVVLAYAVIANGNYKRITRNHGVDYGLGASSTTRSYIRASLRER